MWVDQAAAAPGVDVLGEQGFQQGGLAGASLADDVEMAQAVGLLDAERDMTRPVVRHREVGDVALGRLPLHPRMMSAAVPVLQTRDAAIAGMECPVPRAFHQ